MSMPSIQIIPYKKSFQPDVDAMMKTISDEFGEPIFSSSSIKMEFANRIINHKFWVASENGKIIGTAGIILLKNHNAALKSMFLLKEARGDSRQIARLLLNTILRHATKHKTLNLYLGTMTQFEAAQRFYEKQGFVRIEPNELPLDFGANVLDTLFYKIRL